LADRPDGGSPARSQRGAAISAPAPTSANTASSTIMPGLGGAESPVDGGLSRPE
jgi:hypothetical protein